MKYAIITGSRADWIGQNAVAHKMRDAGLDFEIIITRREHSKIVMHEWPAATANIFSAGFYDPSQEVGFIVANLSAYFVSKRTDAAIIVGDRWDALAAAFAATLCGVKIAHIAGGDLTSGSYDNQMRDAITAMATYHFVTNQAALMRLLSEPDRKFLSLSGSPSTDWLFKKQEWSWNEADQMCRQQRGRPLILINWQPETMASDPNKGLRLIFDNEFIASVETFKVIVGPNLDKGSKEADALIRKWEVGRSDALYIESMSPMTYRIALSMSRFLIGNSSSGIYEAPVLGKWSINVGARQDGRPQDNSVVHVELTDDEKQNAYNLDRAVLTATRVPVPERKLLFGKGRSAETVVNTLIQLEMINDRATGLEQPAVRMRGQNFLR